MSDHGLTNKKALARRLKALAAPPMSWVLPGYGELGREREGSRWFQKVR
jgi:hypothetical protein